MRAVYFEQYAGPLEIRDVADPQPTADGVVIRVQATGLCRSDWHGWMGHDSDVRLPHVPGHEFAGVVDEVGADVEQFRVGDRVTVPFCVGCGTCCECSDGHPQVCDDYFQPGFTAWGSFAERVAIPHADFNLIRLPEAVDMVAAASLGCRFVTAYHGLVRQTSLQPEQWLAVHGCGGVGLAAIQIGRSLGAQIVAVDVNPATLALARQLGAQHTIAAKLGGGSDEVVAELRDITGGGAHVSLDAIGGRDACLQSIGSLRKRGRHVQVGLMVADSATPEIPMGRVVAEELELVGSHGIAAHEYPELLSRIQRGELDPGSLVSQRIGLSEVPARLAALGDNRHVGVTVIEL